MTQEEKVERLKELMRIAKEKRVARTQSEFAEFIGIPVRTLEDNIKRASRTIDRYINVAENKLRDEGVSLQQSDTERLRNMEKRIERLERLVLPKDITDETL